ncbi:MAG: hypothetical protein WC378_01730 [Opitutaceae bacterium]|jgi:hypothetical protein
MNIARIAYCLGIFAVVAALHAHAAEASIADGDELNVWPFTVIHTQGDGSSFTEEHLGPLFFSSQKPDGEKAQGFRPFGVERSWEKDNRSEFSILYPIFVYRTRRDESQWSLFNLINYSSPTAKISSEEPRGFDVWPFYFSRRTGDPATSYTALFPIAGTLKNRFGSDRIDWTLFPLYGRFQQREKVVTTAPWPFVRIIRGGNHRGWALWPIAGWREEAGKSRSQFYLWPLIYRADASLDEPKPSLSAGVLPFYTVDRDAESVSESYLWPFFGYTNRTAPYRYRETRLLWPLFVQGRGEDHHRTRWAPFYTHSEIKGTDKTWVLWPLFRQQAWTDAGLDQCKTQIFFFLYWSLQQRRAGQPDSAPYAAKTHIWPLLSAWDNGAGRTQLQILSPLEVFFPTNDIIRTAYSPLFALYRFEQRAPGNTRCSFLWNAVTFEKNEASGSRHFHLGPIVSLDKQPDSGRFALLCGVLGFRRLPGQNAWRPFVFDFSNRAAKPASHP